MKVKYLEMFCAFLIGLILGHSLNFPQCGNGETYNIDDDNYLLVVLVLTAPKNVDRRVVIRDTWASLRPKHVNTTSDYQNNVIFIPSVRSDSFLELDSIDIQKRNFKKYQEWLSHYNDLPNVKMPGLKVKVIFTVGIKNLESSLVDELHAEQQVYNDLMFIDNLIDSYQNLSLKLVESLKALYVRVPNFKYVLKTDDDSYVKLDLLTFDLINFDRKLMMNRQYNVGLYWGYFNGKANIKKSGQWQEHNYHICDRYVSYALGGGYVLSRNIVGFISSYGNELNLFKNEDISMGTWLSPFKTIYRRHDVRFDTAYIPRKCKVYHLILHKRTIRDMKEIFKGNLCSSEISYDENFRPMEYFYDWSRSPMKCCDNINTN